MPEPVNPPNPATPAPGASPASGVSGAPFDAKAWLKDFSAQTKLTPEQLNAIEPILTSESASAYLRDQVLMRQDYSRRQNELADQKKQFTSQIEAQKAEVVKYFNDLKIWQQAQESRYGLASKEASDARARVAAMEAKAREAAATYGIATEELIPASEPPVERAEETKPPDKTPDTPQYLTAQQGRTLAELIPYVSAVLDDLAYEHQQLTGERLSAKAKREMLQEAIATGKINTSDDVDQVARSVWESKYQIKDKRDSITKAEHEKALKEAYERGARESRSGEALPVPAWNANPQRPNALMILKKHQTAGSKDYLNNAARDFEKRMARLQQSA